MATPRTIADRYILRASIEDNASPAAAVIRDAFEKAGIAAEAVGAQVERASGRITAAMRDFSAYSSRYDSVTQAANRLARAQENLTAAQDAGQKALAAGDIDAATYARTIAVMTGEVEKLATGLGKAKGAIKETGDEQKRLNDLAAAGTSAIKAQSEALSAQAEKAKQVADWMAKAAKAQQDATDKAVAYQKAINQNLSFSRGAQTYGDGGNTGVGVVSASQQSATTTSRQGDVEAAFAQGAKDLAQIDKLAAAEQSYQKIKAETQRLAAVGVTDQARANELIAEQTAAYQALVAELDGTAAAQRALAAAQAQAANEGAQQDALVKKAMEDMAAASQAAQRQLDDLNKSLSQQRASIDEVYLNSKKYEDQWNNLNNLLAIGKLNQAQYDVGLQELNASYAASAGPLSNFVKAQKDAAAATKDAAAAQAELTALRAKYDPTFAAEQKYKQTMDEIAKAVKETGLSEQAANVARANALRTLGDSVSTTNRARTTVEQHTASLRNSAAASNQMRFATQQFSVQSVQLFSSIASGQPIMLSLIQQIHQMIDVALATGTSWNVVGAVFGKVFSAIANHPFASLAIALTAVEAAAIAMSENTAHVLNDMQQHIRAVSDDYKQLGVDAIAAAKEAARTSPVSTKDAYAAAQTFSATPDYSLTSKDLASFIITAAQAAKVLGIDVPEAAKKFSGAIGDAGALAQEFADKHLFGVNEEMARQLKLQVAAGQGLDAYRTLMDQVNKVTHDSLEPVTALDKEYEKLKQTLLDTGQSGKSFATWLGEGWGNVVATAIAQARGLVEAVNSVRDAVSKGPMNAPGSVLTNPKSGAMGYMQVIPDAGTTMRYGYDVRVPEQNVAAGLTDLKTKYEAAGGNLDLALKNYGGFKTKDPSAYIAAVKSADISKLPTDLVSMIEFWGQSLGFPRKLIDVGKQLAVVESQGRQFVAGGGAPAPTFVPHETAAPSVTVRPDASLADDKRLYELGVKQTQSANTPALKADTYAANVAGLTKSIAAAGRLGIPADDQQVIAMNQALAAQRKLLEDAIPAADLAARGIDRHTAAEERLTKAYGAGLSQVAQTKAYNDAVVTADSKFARGTDEWTDAVQKNTRANLDNARAVGAADIAKATTETDLQTASTQRLTAATQQSAAAREQAQAREEAKRQLDASGQAGAANYAEQEDKLTASILGRGRAEADLKTAGVVVQLDEQIASTDRLTKATEDGYASAARAAAQEQAWAQARAQGLIPGTVAFTAAQTKLTAKNLENAKSTHEKALADAELEIQYQRGYVQAEIASIGMESHARDLLLAGIQNEHQLKQQLGDDYDKLGPKRLTELNQLEKEKLAYQDLQSNLSYLSGQFESAFNTIGDAMAQAFVQGQGAAVNWGNVMKAVVQQVIQAFLRLAILNPILNSLFAQNNPTLSSAIGAVGALANSGGGAAAGGGSGGGALGALSTIGSGISSASSVSGAFGGPSIGSLLGITGENGLLSQAGSALGLTGESGLFSSIGSGISSFLGQGTGIGVSANLGTATLEGLGLGAGQGLGGATLGSALSGGFAGVGAGYGLGSLAGGLVQSAFGKTGPAPKIGAGVGALGGAGAGFIIGGPVGALIGGIIGGLGGGVGGGFIGPKLPTPYSSTNVGVDSAGLARITGSNGQLVDLYKQDQGIEGQLNQIDQFLQGNDLRIGGQTSFSQFGVGGGRDKFQDLYTPNSTNATAFSKYRFDASGTTKEFHDYLAEQSFPTLTELATAVQSYKTAQAQITDLLTNTVPSLTKVTTVTGKLADAQKAVGDQYAAVIAPIAALKTSLGISASQVQQLTDAEGLLTTARDKAIQAASDAADAQVAVTYQNLNARYLTAHATNTGDAGDAQYAKLYSFDIAAEAERKKFNDDLVATFGDAFKGTQAYNDLIAAEEKTLGEERLAIVKDTAAAVVDTQKKEAEAAAKSATQSAIQFIDGLRTYVQSLTFGDTSPLSPRAKLDVAQYEFTNTANRAVGGDATAMKQIQGASTNLLAAARQMFGSSPEYVRVFQEVTSVLGAIASKTPDELTAAFLAEQVQTATETLDKSLQGLRSDVGVLRVATITSAGDNTVTLGGNLTQLWTGSTAQTVGATAASTDALWHVIHDMIEWLGVSVVAPYTATFGSNTVAAINNQGNTAAWWLAVINGTVTGKLDNLTAAVAAQRSVSVTVTGTAANNNTAPQYTEGGGGEGGESSGDGGGSYARGGWIGNGVWNRDTVRARYAGGPDVMLAGGEYVVNAPAAARYGGMLESINAAGLRGMAGGGFVSGASANDNAAVINQLTALRNDTTATFTYESRMMTQLIVEQLMLIRQEIAALRREARQAGATPSRIAA